MPSLDINQPTAPVPSTGFEATGTIDPMMGTWISGEILFGSSVTAGRVLKHDNTWKVTFPPLPGGTLATGNNQTLRVQCLNFDCEDAIPLDVFADSIVYKRSVETTAVGNIQFIYPSEDGEIYRAPLVWAAGTANPPLEEVYGILFNPADPTVPQLGQVFQLGGLWVCIFVAVKKGDGQILRMRFKNPALTGKATRIVHVRY